VIIPARSEYAQNNCDLNNLSATLATSKTDADKHLMKFKNLFSTNYFGDGLSLLAGAMLTLAFSPFGIFPLSILSPALLLGLWLYVTPRRAFWRGWLYGIGLFGTGVSWVYISIHTFGGTSTALALFITCGFISLLALFPALTGYVLNRRFPELNNSKILCAFPALWVLSEWIRSWLFTGFPWLLLGDSQISAPLKGYAPIFSTYGVSLAVVLSSGLLVNAVLKLHHKQTKLAYYSFFTFALLWFLGGALSFVTWTKPMGAPIQVSLVQGSIPQELKWAADNVLPTLHHYEDLSKPYWKSSKLIIWPEGAIPMTLQDAKEFVDHMGAIAASSHATFITGIPVKVLGKSVYNNAVIGLGEGGGVYLKRRLVPFGEYTPGPSMLNKLMGFLDIPMSDFVPGRVNHAPFMANGVRLSVFICYEIAFAEQVRIQTADVGMILTVSNDAWFGHSIAQAQHLQTAQMRAIEMGRPVLSVSNDGITAIINSSGDIQSAAPPYQPYVLTDKVQPRTGKTPWQYLSLDPLLLILVGMLFIARRALRPKSKEAAHVPS